MIRSRGVSLVIPTVDEEIDVLAGEVEKGGEVAKLVNKDKIVLHPVDTVRSCLDKLLFYDYVSMRVPEIVPEYPVDPDELESSIVVKKPRRGHRGRSVAVGRKEEFTAEPGFFYVEYLPGR